MARRRMMDPSFWDDEDVGALSDGARLLLLCCISNADDYGKITGSAAAMKKIAFGFTDRTTADVEALLQEIDEHISGFHRYTVNGKQYIALLHWHRYQRVDHPQASIIPDPQNGSYDPPEYQRNSKKNEDESSSENGSENGSENAARQLINESINQPSNEGSSENELHNNAAAANSRTAHPIYKSHITRAYLDVITPGAMIPSDHIERAYAAVQELEQHPCSGRWLRDYETACEAFKWFLTQRKYERKPLQYIARALIDKMEKEAAGVGV